MGRLKTIAPRLKSNARRGTTSTRRSSKSWRYDGGVRPRSANQAGTSSIDSTSFSSSAWRNTRCDSYRVAQLARIRLGAEHRLAAPLAVAHDERHADVGFELAADAAHDALDERVRLPRLLDWLTMSASAWASRARASARLDTWSSSTSRSQSTTRPPQATMSR